MNQLYKKEDVEALLVYKNETNKKELTPSEVAKRLGLTLQTFYKYIAEGIIELTEIPLGDERLTWEHNYYFVSLIDS